MALFGELNKPTRVIKYTAVDSETIQIVIDNEEMTIEAKLLDSFISSLTEDIKRDIENQIGIVKALPDLADVELVTLLNGDILEYNGDKWVNSSRLNILEQRVDDAKVSYAFDTEQQLENWLSGTYTRPDGITPEDLKIGNNIYIIKLDERDFWVSSLPVNNIDDLSPLQNDKVDLTEYAKQTWVSQNYINKEALAGGTAGQALVKKSDSDNDYEWQDMETSSGIAPQPLLTHIKIIGKTSPGCIGIENLESYSYPTTVHWGDGTKDTYTLAPGERYYFKHTYKDNKAKIIYIAGPIAYKLVEAPPYQDEFYDFQWVEINIGAGVRVLDTDFPIGRRQASRSLRKVTIAHRGTWHYNNRLEFNGPIFKGLDTLKSFIDYAEPSSSSARDRYNSIPDEMFQGCTNLREFKSDRMFIRDRAFSNTPRLRTFDFSKIESVGSYAFVNSGITDVIAPLLYGAGSNSFSSSSIIRAYLPRLDLTHSPLSHRLFGQHPHIKYLTLGRQHGTPLPNNATPPIFEDVNLIRLEVIERPAGIVTHTAQEIIDFFIEQGGTFNESTTVQHSIQVEKDPENPLDVLRLKDLESDVIFDLRENFPENGEAEVLYIATDEKIGYLWDTDKYIIVFSIVDTSSFATTQWINENFLNIEDSNELIKNVEYEAATGKLLFTRKNNSTFEIDLPTELIVQNGFYNSETKEIILVLANEAEIRIPVGDLIDGFVTSKYLETNYYTKEEADLKLDEFVTKEKLDTDLSTKVDKQQSVEDAGKVLGIGEDGLVKAVKQGGGSDIELSKALRIVDLNEPLPSDIVFNNAGYKTPNVRYLNFHDNREDVETVAWGSTALGYIIEPAVNREDFMEYFTNRETPIDFTKVWTFPGAGFVSVNNIQWSDVTETITISPSWINISTQQELETFISETTGNVHLAYIPNMNEPYAEFYRSPSLSPDFWSDTLKNRVIKNLTYSGTLDVTEGKLTDSETAVNIETLYAVNKAASSYISNSTVPAYQRRVQDGASNSPTMWMPLYGSESYSVPYNLYTNKNYVENIRYSPVNLDADPTKIRGYLSQSREIIPVVRQDQHFGQAGKFLGINRDSEVEALDIPTSSVDLWIEEGW